MDLALHRWCRWVYRNPITAGMGIGSSTDYPADAALHKPHVGADTSDPADAALQYSHMGMLATLPNGTLAAVWQVTYLGTLINLLLFWH
jgi:hypothetical protein